MKQTVKTRLLDEIYALVFTEDTVYMENEVWRKEYVLNDKGLIWMGSQTSFFPKKWVFGQVCVIYGKFEPKW